MLVVVRRFSSVAFARRLNFENHGEAFRDKSTLEILRTLAVLKICSFDSFVDNSLLIMEKSRRYLGDHFVDGIARRTFYQQFIGGDRPEYIQQLVARLRRLNVRPMLVCTMEEDIGDHDSGNEAVYDRNLKRVLDCLELTRSLEAQSPTMQLKITSLFSANLLVRLSELFTCKEDKLTMVNLFAERMSGKSLSRTCKDIEALSRTDGKQIESGIERLQRIGQTASNHGIKVLVDAEYTYVNPAINLLALSMMKCFNHQQPYVWNTYQCYLKNALPDVQRDSSLADALGVCFGVKLVRGAYITLEQSRAIVVKQPNPVCESYEATNNNYNKVLDVLLQRIASARLRCNIVAATHNEESIRFAIKRMEELSIAADSGNVNFAQLYGMCDQVTYPLATEGYAVYKSIPYGPLQEALPYLARRAVENRSVLAGARKEQILLRKELLTRIFRRESKHRPQLEHY